MRKLILILLLLTNSQGSTVVGQSKSQRQERQANQQTTISPTPTPSVQPVGEQRDAVITGNQADRARNITIVDERSPWPSWIANIISALLLAFVGYQAYVSKEVLKSMRETETFLRSQLKTLRAQAIASLSQARSNRETLIAAKKTAADQLLALQGQWKAMDDSVGLMRSQTRTLASQAQAALEQRDLMEGQLRALELGEAPYFGLVGINTRGIGVSVSPVLTLSFKNGGKTPAWHFNGLACLAIGDSPNSPNHWFISPEAKKISETFYASGEEKKILYNKTDLRLTLNQYEALRDKEEFLYLIVTVTFKDFRGRLCPSQTFICGYDIVSGAFGDYQIT